MNHRHAQKTILVIEDEAPLLEAIKMKLEKSGFHVITARSVVQAMDHLTNGSEINAVWLDHFLLGKESGLDFVIACKAEGSKHASVPIFLVSNTAGADTIQAYMKLGVDKYYVKAQRRLDGIVDDVKAELDIAKEPTS